MRTAAGGRTRPGRTRPRAALGAGGLRSPGRTGRTGRGRTGRAGRSGRAGSGRLPGLVPGLVLGFTPEPGEEKRGEGPEFNPFGTCDPRDHRGPPGSAGIGTGGGRGGGFTPKCGSWCLPPPSVPPSPGGGDSPSVQGVSPALSPPCPLTWLSHSDSPSSFHQVQSTQFEPPTPPTPVRVPPVSVPKP